MKIHQLKRVQLLPISMEQAWDFFSDPKNLNEITPPDMSFQILSGANERMYAGQLIRYRINPLFDIPMQWVTEITHCEDHRYFVDEQRFGPYSLWHHQHHFKEVDGGIEMIDLLHYKLPMGWLGNLLAGHFVKGKVEHIFDYRYEVLEQLFSKEKKAVPAQD